MAAEKYLTKKSNRLRKEAILAYQKSARSLKKKMVADLANYGPNLLADLDRSEKGYFTL